MTDDLFFIFLLKLKILESKVKFWCGTHMYMTHLFLKKFLIFTQNFRREWTVFHFISKENGKSEAVFQHFWSAQRQLKKKLHSGKSEASESKELKLKLVWPKHTKFYLFLVSYFSGTQIWSLFYCKTDNFRCVASCYRFSCYYRFSDIAINSVNPSFIWRLEFSKNG